MSEHIASSEPQPSATTAPRGVAREQNSGATSRQLQLRSILAPVDFSLLSERAARYAVSLAQPFGAKVALLHVVEPAKLDEDLIGLDFATYCADAKSRLDAFAERTLPPEMRADTKVRRGPAFAQIVSEASHSDTDLIVLATHGHSGFQHLLLGSTAERVVRHAMCPVLVVRE